MQLPSLCLTTPAQKSGEDYSPFCFSFHEPESLNERPAKGLEQCAVMFYLDSFTLERRLHLSTLRTCLIRRRHVFFSFFFSQLNLAIFHPHVTV